MDHTPSSHCGLSPPHITWTTPPQPLSASLSTAFSRACDIVSNNSSGSCTATKEERDTLHSVHLPEGTYSGSSVVLWHICSDINVLFTVIPCGGLLEAKRCIVPQAQPNQHLDHTLVYKFNMLNIVNVSPVAVPALTAHAQCTRTHLFTCTWSGACAECEALPCVLCTDSTHLWSLLRSLFVVSRFVRPSLAAPLQDRPLSSEGCTTRVVCCASHHRCKLSSRCIDRL